MRGVGIDRGVSGKDKGGGKGHLGINNSMRRGTF